MGKARDWEGHTPEQIATMRASLERLRFDRPVTFFVGENSSGKSTLLEAIAVALGFNAEGGSRNFRFATTGRSLTTSGVGRHYAYGSGRLVYQPPVQMWRCRVR